MPRRARIPPTTDPLSAFRPATRDWFGSAFDEPTAAQAQGWPGIARGEHTLICAPTGSGKTLAAFLWCLDRLMRDDTPAARERRAARAVRLAAQGARPRRRPQPARAAAWHRARRAGSGRGDADGARRHAHRRHAGRRAGADGKQPPDILVTTPESLYLLLTSAAREALRGVEWVIVDEIHALAGTKRGAHLALSLERLAAITDRQPQRIGLSATQRPLSAVAGYLGGRLGRR